MVYLIDWTLSNWLVFFTLLVIFGIPVVILAITLGNNKKQQDE